MLQDSSGHCRFPDVPYKDTVHIKLGLSILPLDKKNPGISVDIGSCFPVPATTCVAHFFCLVQILFPTRDNKRNYSGNRHLSGLYTRQESCNESRVFQSVAVVQVAHDGNTYGHNAVVRIRFNLPHAFAEHIQSLVLTFKLIIRETQIEIIGNCSWISA